MSSMRLHSFLIKFRATLKLCFIAIRFMGSSSTHRILYLQMYFRMGPIIAGFGLGETLSAFWVESICSSCLLSSERSETSLASLFCLNLYSSSFMALIYSYISTRPIGVGVILGRDIRTECNSICSACLLSSDNDCSLESLFFLSLWPNSFMIWTLKASSSSIQSKSQKSRLSI